MITAQDKYELDARNAARHAAMVAARDASARTARLSAMLAEAGRVGDIKRVAEDEAYREQLYAEFGI